MKTTKDTKRGTAKRPAAKKTKATARTVAKSGKMARDDRRPGVVLGEFFREAFPGAVIIGGKLNEWEKPFLSARKKHRSEFGHINFDDDEIKYEHYHPTAVGW